MRQLGPPHAGEPAVIGLVNRLISLLDREVTALRSGSPLLLEANTEEKHLILRELLGLQKAGLLSSALLKPKGLDVKLRQSLELNRRELRNHIAAVQDVSRIIIDSIKQFESDGTYSRERM